MLAVMAGACAGSTEPEIAPTTVDADRLLFERGTAALEEADYLRAREYFLQIRDNYPQSAFRAEARLGIGDSYVGQGSPPDFVAATAEFQDFLSVYPTHPRAPYAQFKLGHISYLQMRGPDRDQSFTRSAIRDFETFVERWPNSELMPEVRGYLREVRDRLSESEVVVGRYYHQNNWWPGAISRLRSVLEEDPEFAGRDAVYFYLGDSYRRSGTGAEALPLFERLLEEFPESEFVEEVNEVLPELRAELAAQEAAELAEQDADENNANSADRIDETAATQSAPAPTR